MPIYSRRNLYPGVNPHLNSYLQQSGGNWQMFHARHVADIASLLDRQLPDYCLAVSESSLQISGAVDDDAPNGESSRRIEPDVAVYYEGGESLSATTPLNTPTLIFPTQDVLDRKSVV